MDAATQRLIGSWKLVRDETDNDTGEGVTMGLGEDGRLTYSIDQGEATQIMTLTYRVDGDELVTDQASSPREHRTRFWFDEDGLLVLENEGRRSWYQAV